MEYQDTTGKYEDHLEGTVSEHIDEYEARIARKY